MSSQETWTPIALQVETGPKTRPEDATAYPDRNEVLERLSDRRRRRILSLLLREPEAIGESELSTRVAAAEAGVDPADVDEEEVESVSLDLYHVQLPALDDVDLIEWDRDEGTVTTSDHPAFDAPGFRRFLEADAEVGEAIECLSRPRRRRALAVLEDNGGPMTRAELAREVAMAETDGTSTETYEDVLVGLHHVDIPRLEEVGLVECDPDAETVEYVGHPAVDEEWLIC